MHAIEWARDGRKTKTLFGNNNFVKIGEESFELQTTSPEFLCGGKEMCHLGFSANSTREEMLNYYQFDAIQQLFYEKQLEKKRSKFFPTFQMQVNKYC